MSKQPSRKPEIGATSIESDILKAASRFSDHSLADLNQLLKLWGMTALQHSALQAIYVHDKDNSGLPSGEIGRYLITRVPDLTRLLDRMEDKQWVTRERDATNRRVVRTRLTEIGIELVESAHSSVQQLKNEQLAHLSDDDKQALKHLLDLALRQGGE